MSYLRYEGSHWPSSKGITDEVANKSCRALQALYEDSTAFFTKEAMQNAYTQIQQVSPPQMIYINGLDGNAIAFEIMTGEIVEPVPPDCEYVVTKPLLDYSCFQQLVSAHMQHRRSLLQCPLRMTHQTEVRNKFTGERILRDGGQYEKVEQYFVDVQREWQNTSTYTKLQSLLGSNNIGSVKKIVAFALGSLDSDWVNNRPEFQHALLLTLRDHFKVDCYAQDPVYDDVDKAVLAHHNIKVLPDPEGWLALDDETVLLTRCANVPVKEITRDLARPAVVIWADIRDHELGNRTDPDSRRVREMMKGYSRVDFNDDQEHFSDLMMCIKNVS